MKKIKNFFTKNVKILLAFVLGILVSGVTVYAATVIGASEVSYTDNNNLGESTVQGAIDKLYTMAANSSSGGGKDNTIYFAFGTPTTSSTTDYTTLNKAVFIALNGNQKSVCIKRNSKLHCFDNNNYLIEKDHMTQVFSSSASCTSNSSYNNCYDTSGTAVRYSCILYPAGGVYCVDSISHYRCTLNEDNTLSCGD